jgi:lipopolysaccharide export system protein LptA
MTQRRTDLALILATGLALLAACPLAPLALTTDREQPIEIEADSAEADDAKGLTIYTGDVVIIQGTLRITGDQVTIFYNENGDITKMETLGNPARFSQLPDGKADEEANYQRARASRMEYYKDNDAIVLLGNAVYGQGGDRVSADRIDYDSKNSRMKAQTMTASSKSEVKQEDPKQKGRVRITIQPRKKSN